MKNLTLIFTAFLCFAIQNSYSQETVKDRAYVADYNRLQELHLKELDSEIHIEYSKKLSNFLNKAGKKMPQSVNHPDDIINWVKDNLEETDFMSYTEAELEWGIINQLQAESMKQNKEYHDFMLKVVLKYGAEMITDEMMNTMNEYPEKFGLPAEFKGQLKDN